MESKGSWDTHLALMEFAYNNSYQASIITEDGEIAKLCSIIVTGKVSVLNFIFQY